MLFKFLIIIRYKMGTICHGKTKDKEIRYSTKAVLQPDNYDNKISFYFSTENLLRIDADCLILFCDQKMNLNKNAFISKVGKFETRKIKEFADSHLLVTKTKVIPGQIIIFPISISTLRFKFIALTCLKIWDGHEKVRINLEKILESLFKSLKDRKVQSIGVTEFNEQFGIPTHLGCKLLAEGVHSNQEWLKVVTFICIDSTSQSYYMQRITNYKSADSQIKSDPHSTQSNYY